MYVLIWLAEFVTLPSPKQSIPHFEATIPSLAALKYQGSEGANLTEDFVTDAMLLEEVTQQLFVHPRLVHHLVMALVIYQMSTFGSHSNIPRYPRTCNRAQ